MNIPDYYVSDEEFAAMPIIDRAEAYETKPEGVKFLFGNGIQWGTHRNGMVGVLNKESDRIRLFPRPVSGKVLSRNQAKKRRQKARKK